MINKNQIVKEIKKQVSNFKTIENRAKSNTNSQKLMGSIQGTEQRKAILSNTNVDDLVKMYLSEIDSTSQLLFTEDTSEKEKILNALEYIRLTVNDESEKIDNIDNLSISGINAAILGEGNSKSQNCYFRDLMEYNGINTSSVIVDYTDENGNTTKKELVQVKLKDGQTLLLSPADYNCSLHSIEKFNTQDYRKKASKPFSKENASTINFSEEDLSNSISKVHNKLIEKYKIKEMSNIIGLDSATTADNQLKILGLVGSNLTPIQSDDSELFRTVKMNDGKEIEVSKLLELFYTANDMQYTQYLGQTKDSDFFEFNIEDAKYTISPNDIFRTTKGDNINASAIFTSDDTDKALKTLSGAPNDSLDRCQTIMNSKTRLSFLNVKDFNIADLQNSISENPNSLDLIKKQELIKHYSLDDISFQLGITDMFKSGKADDQLKAHKILMAYLNNQSYDFGYDGTHYKAITFSDGKAMYLNDVLELFFLQNGVEYTKNNDGTLNFKSNGKDYSWKYDYNALLSDKALSTDLLSNQSLIDVSTGEVVKSPSLKSMDNEIVDSAINLSQRIPTTQGEIANMLKQAKSLASDIDSLPDEYSIDNQVGISNRFEKTVQKYYPEEYEKYKDVKKGKADYYSKTNEEKLEEYKQKVETVSNNISSQCKTDEEKILTTLEYVRLSGMYENMADYEGMNMGGYLSQDGMSYALTGEGVCASQAQYTRDLLNSLGIDANVENCHLDLNQNVGFADNSNHLIVKVNLNGKTLAVDPTNYLGTADSLKSSDWFSMVQTSESEDIRFQMQREGKSDEEISAALSKISESAKLKASISAEIYPKHILDNKLRTPFGFKSLKELNFACLETTNDKISDARKKAANILLPELGIDNISESLHIAETSDDEKKQSLILGYIESNLQEPESDKTEDIRTRVAKVGDRNLEISDILELFYLQNGIDYNITTKGLLNLNMNGENVSINAAKAYKNSLPVEAERNNLIKKSDGTYLELSSLIEKSMQEIKQKFFPYQSFVDKYKVPEESLENNTQNTQQDITPSHNRDSNSDQYR